MQGIFIKRMLFFYQNQSVIKIDFQFIRAVIICLGNPTQLYSDTDHFNECSCMLPNKKICHASDLLRLINASYSQQILNKKNDLLH